MLVVTSIQRCQSALLQEVGRAPITEDQDGPRGGDDPQTDDPRNRGVCGTTDHSTAARIAALMALANTPVGMLR
jgi:hypothetical protein